MNVNLRIAIPAAVAAILWAGCTPTSADATSPWDTRGVSNKATGEPIEEIVDVATGLGMGCAHVDDRPYLVWACYQTVDRYMRLTLLLTSVNRKDVSMVTMVAANSLDLSTEEDPTPYIIDLAKAIVPASYSGPERADILESVTNGSPGGAEPFGPVTRSWLGGDDTFQNLTLFFGLFEPSASSDVFDEFHVEDAWAWGESAGLECSQGVLDPNLGGFEMVRCATREGPRAAIDFMLEFKERPADDPGPPEFSDTDIRLCNGNFLPKEAGSKEALADLVASLVKRMSGSSDDAARAREWVVTYADAEVESMIGTLNAELYVGPGDFVPAFYASIHMGPVGSQVE